MVLAIYGGAEGGDDDTPVKDKSELPEYLRHLIAEAVAFCAPRDIDLEAVKAAQSFDQAIKVILDKGLYEVYEEGIYAVKCDTTYRHVYDCYSGEGESIYEAANP